MLCLCGAGSAALDASLAEFGIAELLDVLRCAQLETKFKTHAGWFGAVCRLLCEAATDEHLDTIRNVVMWPLRSGSVVRLSDVSCLFSDIDERCEVYGMGCVHVLKDSSAVPKAFLERMDITRASMADVARVVLASQHDSASTSSAQRWRELHFLRDHATQFPASMFRSPSEAAIEVEAADSTQPSEVRLDTVQSVIRAAVSVPLADGSVAPAPRCYLPCIVGVFPVAREEWSHACAIKSEDNAVRTASDIDVADERRFERLMPLDAEAMLAIDPDAIKCAVPWICSVICERMLLCAIWLYVGAGQVGELPVVDRCAPPAGSCHHIVTFCNPPICTCASQAHTAWHVLAACATHRTLYPDDRLD